MHVVAMIVRSTLTILLCDLCVLCLTTMYDGGGGGGGFGVISERCQADKLTVYKVVLHTFWSRDKFPKHYPDWRPPAQWSKVFGRSHDKSFTLFRLGQQSSLGVKAFAETGRSDLLEEQTQGEGGIYDEFNAPPIPQGVGRTEAEFFVDGNHSRVSLISRVIPSPDWFIGIDNFDLCVNGNWLDSITIEVDPIDAGTDNGFTFTAPNWPTDPQGVAYRITSRYPAHPAGSFFYPNMKRLPAIATFQFIKVKEYELSEVFHHVEDEQHYELLKMEHLTQNSINVFNGNSDIETAIEEERREQEVAMIHQRQRPAANALPVGSDNDSSPPLSSSSSSAAAAAAGESYRTYSNSRARFQFLFPQPPPPPQVTPSTTTTAAATTLSPSITTNEDRLLNTINHRHDIDDDLIVTASSSSSSSSVAASGMPSIVPRGDKNAILNSIVDSYRTHAKDHHRSNNKKYRKTKKIRPPRDCRVSDWSPWSACSKSCGIGEMQRRRDVLKHARRGGRFCPPLVETKWCGSARSCNNGYFNW